MKPSILERSSSLLSGRPVALIPPFMSLFKYSSGFRSGTVSWEEEDLDPLLMVRSPSLYLLRLVGLQPIHDQEDLPSRLAEQSLQERDEQRGRHRLLVGHEMD